MDPLETQARTETICKGCTNEKQIGLVVCWNCFKYRRDTIPFKDFDGTLSQWLQQLNTKKY